MLGAITGDVAGSAYEFHNTKDIRFEMFPEGSGYTDDTIMTLAVARWLLTDPDHGLQSLEDIMVDMAAKNPSPMGGYGTMFRDWLFSPRSLQPFEGERLPYVSGTGRHPYGSWGNGSAMRVSPVGWFFNSLEETERVAALSASITHDHTEGIMGAQAVAAAIFLARRHKTRDGIRDYIENKYGYDLHKSWDYWHGTYEWDASCQGTVPQAIIAFLESRDYEDAIRKAVALGGDSDTLACITGGIAEAFYLGVPGHLAWKVIAKLPGDYIDTVAALYDRIGLANLEWAVCEGASIERFIAPQDEGGRYARILSAIREGGLKEGEDLRYVFPTRGHAIGEGFKEAYFSLRSLFEAKWYLSDGTLAGRLRDLTLSVLARGDAPLEAILGGKGNAERFRACMTVFSAASPGDVFTRALERFFRGEEDRHAAVTLEEERTFYDGPSPLTCAGVPAEMEKAFFEDPNLASQEERERRLATILDCMLIGNVTMKAMMRHYIWHRDFDAERLDRVKGTLFSLVATMPAFLLDRTREVETVTIMNAGRGRMLRVDGLESAAESLDKEVEWMLESKYSARPLIRFLGKSLTRNGR